MKTLVMMDGIEVRAIAEKKSQVSSLWPAKWETTSPGVTCIEEESEGRNSRITPVPKSSF